MARLTVKAEDIQDLPAFNAAGWNDFTDAAMLHGKCFAYALDNQDMAVIPGKGNDRIRANTNMIESLMGQDIALQEPPELPYDGHLESYARKQWQNVVERDGMIPVAPDENGVLNVPKGASLVMLAVQQRRDPVSKDIKASRHWYRADQPREGTEDVTWSHWDGESAPKRYAGADSIRDPWEQCAFDKYRPVGYFLVASKKALEGAGDPRDTATLAQPPKAQSTISAPAA